MQAGRDFSHFCRFTTAHRNQIRRYILYRQKALRVQVRIPQTALDFNSQTKSYDPKREHWLGSPDQKISRIHPHFNPTLTQPIGKLFGRYSIHITNIIYQALLHQNNIKNSKLTREEQPANFGQQASLIPLAFFFNFPTRTKPYLLKISIKQAIKHTKSSRPLPIKPPQVHYLMSRFL